MTHRPIENNNINNRRFKETKIGTEEEKKKERKNEIKVSK
jgi:hypothetical protein